MRDEGQRKIPLLVKIDPDLNDQALEELVKTITDHQVDGIIATNTTINHRHNEKGGLSGKPLFQSSTQVVQRLHNLLSGQLPIIAVGGVFSAEDAIEKFEAGASLIQIYSGLIYQGPGLISKIVKTITDDDK